jgi:riboflavin synthase
MKNIDKEKKFIISISLREKEVNKLNELKSLVDDTTKGFSNIIRLLIYSNTIKKRKGN